MLVVLFFLIWLMLVTFVDLVALRCVVLNDVAVCNLPFVTLILLLVYIWFGGMLIACCLWVFGHLRCCCLLLDC